jgi:hypothetical protein
MRRAVLRTRKNEFASYYNRLPLVKEGECRTWPSAELFFTSDSLLILQVAKLRSCEARYKGQLLGFLSSLFPPSFDPFVLLILMSSVPLLLQGQSHVTRLRSSSEQQKSDRLSTIQRLPLRGSWARFFGDGEPHSSHALSSLGVWMRERKRDLDLLDPE